MSAGVANPRVCWWLPVLRGSLEQTAAEGRAFDERPAMALVDGACLQIIVIAATMKGELRYLRWWRVAATNLTMLFR